MGDPKNAQLNGDGFRFYRWTDNETGIETDVLSVTSIRKLCGEPFPLVNWRLANIADVAMGTVKRPAIGKRGKPLKGKFTNRPEEFPSEFVRRYTEADGQQAAMDDVRRWLRDSADEPRNIAARRGSIVHSAIEKNVAWDRIERPYVELEFAALSDRDRKQAKDGVKDEDVTFVRNAVRQYWHMRTELPFVIIARELQCFNLTAGYAGSFDALIWLLGEFGPCDCEQCYEEGDTHPAVFYPLNIDPATLPKARDITIEDVRRIGGTLVCADWKTSKDIHTDQVIQDVAYLSTEFVGTDGIKDMRLTELLTAAQHGALVHIRPGGWGFHVFKYTDEMAAAFVGSCIFARFLAKYSKPTALFLGEFKGESTEVDEWVDDDE